MTAGVTTATQVGTAQAAREVADMELLRHTLGMASNVKPRDHGYRNYFNAGPGHYDMPGIQRLVDRGLMLQNPNRPEYWHATEAGCKVAGLTGRQLKNAMEGRP